MQFSGYVTVPTDGQYTFYTNSDDGSRLYIGSTLVVDNDGLHGDREIASTIGLKAGTHAITVAFFQDAGGQNLQVSYAGPGLTKQVIPASAYKRVSATGVNNQMPVANAGAAQTITLPTNSVTLSGAASTDADGTINSYLWSQVSGPSTASFSSASAAAPVVSGLVAGTYVFNLVVTDNLGALSNPAQVSITVNANNTLRTPENPTGTIAGLNYKYYEGFWDMMPAFASLTPNKTGTSTAFELTAQQRDYAFAFQFTGYVTVPTDGQYTFYTNSDDGSMLYIGSTLVVNNDGAHGDREIASTIGLKAGTHALTVAYLQGYGGQNLQVSYAGPNIAKQLIPVSALKRTSGAANQAPVANAGVNQTITLPTTSVTLNGSASADTDGGTIATYLWAQVSGPNTPTFSNKTVAQPVVSGLAAGTYVFSLVVTDNLGLQSTPAQVTVTVNASACQLAAPTVTTPLAYCQGATATPLSTSITPANGATLTIYQAATGSTALASTFAPATTDVGSTMYYVSQTLGACESPRVAVVVNVTASPAAPTVTSPLAYCQGATAAALSSSVTASTGATLKIYSVATGGTALANTFVPSTTALGSTTYYVAQTLGSCESPRTPLVVNVTTTASVPTVATPVTYCQGATAAALSASVTIAAGNTLKIYTATTGTATVANTFVPATTTVGSTTYYVSQTSGTCESARTPLVVNVTASPAAPTVAGPVTYCQGATAAALSSSVTASTGATVKLYTVATGGTALASTFVPPTATVGSTTYYVSQTLGTCESPRVALAVNVTASPAAPTVATPVTYCQGSAASPLSANITLATGATLKIYTTATGTTTVANTFVPATTAVGSTTYYVAQTLGTCESARTPLVVSVTSSLPAPAVVTPVAYCQGAAASPLSASVTLATGATLKIYTAATGGTALASTFAPSTTALGSTTYYVSQASGTCESARVALVVNVTASLAAPTVTTPVTYCQGSTANPLSANVTLAAGNTLKIYSVATGGTALASTFVPATTAVGSTTYYVAQASGTCESARVALVVNVTASPAAPTVTSPLAYCQGATAAALSSSVTLATGATLKIYSVATGGTALANTFVPSTTALGSTTYYVAQTLGSCESPRTPLVVTITSAPGTPNIATAVTYCVGTQSSALTTTVTAPGSTQSGTPTLPSALRTYTTATGGTALPATFQPSTAAVGTTTYYVSQAAGSCESARIAVTVNVVNSIPAPVVVPPAGVDQNNIAAWGDSFTDAQYGYYPQTLSTLSGYSVANLGIGGQTSVQIKDRMLADTGKRTWPTIIWAGRNDSDQGEQVKASIAAMVAALPHKEYVVVSVYNGAGESPGTYGYEHVKSLNEDLATIYGSHFLNIRPYTVSQYNRNDPQDVADFNQDTPPTSLRSDFLHPNKAGCAIIANYIYAHINQLFSVNYCVGATSSALSTNVTMLSGATLKVYTTATGGTALAADFRPATTTVGSTTYYVSQVLNGCESARTPITVNINSCGSTATASATSTSRMAVAAAPTVSVKTFDVYPNPFSRKATIDFSLTQQQSYTLELYDSFGRQVQQIASGVANADQVYSYQIAGTTLREGLYVVRLTAGKASKTFTITLSK
ncbi:hypothetical protein GCM10011383_22770 [Hymenobacter cavernae]|uniref:PA14 domain-containing protein n=2 Tax=Hymenobacter cavernae TaxID=2044852 RepID=A0ABQ1U8C6_9BACT|nr:hypothetical protein GCM10011383_22770 [Hymenobacter cavernae]